MSNDIFEYWFPWNPVRYRSKTMHLTPEQDGIYRRLIDHYMETKSPLPESYHALARIAGCSVEKIEENASSILHAFFQHSNGMYYHEHCNEILDDQEEKSRKRKKIAAGAAKKRWNNCIEKQKENASSNNEAMLPDATGQDRTIKKDNTNVLSKENGKVKLDDLSTDHISEWLGKKRATGKYLNHDEHFILEQFKQYCQAKGKRYVDYIAAYRNAFEWERCQPHIQRNNEGSKSDRAKAAIARGIGITDADFTTETR